MNKKLLALALALGLTLSLTACGGGNDAPAGGDTPAPQNSTPAGGETTADTFVFTTADGKEVAVNEDMADVLAALGEEQSYFEAESCAFEGLDKTYTYPGFVITTRPGGDKDYVNSIRLTDDSVSTREGVYIGSSEQDVTTAYGEDGGSTEGMLSYTAGDVTLNFILEDGVVTSIEYLPA
ncbi:hypothetical protein [Intestinimonas massiliensis (ex Afouda et al. 2020)]|uniref:hypothetical protein n=1 Tax=Intestinimonas massiliensis (ex Afouda et al. 2020) TaxID=1673721 RepID=UPI0013EF3E8A|nr:hypothetical protein [Intestinimonas massiliensis (ex Afouda et al. 2020)]